MVSLDTFYVGRLKGVGAVWQLTAVDIATRIAVVQLIVGDKTAAVAAVLLDHLKKALRKHGINLEGVLTDNGPEFVGKAFQTRVDRARAGPSPDPAQVAEPQRRVRTVPRHRARRVLPAALPPRSRRRRRPARPVAAGLGRRLQPDRPNHGDYMAGRTPLQVKKQLRAASDRLLPDNPVKQPETSTCHPNPWPEGLAGETG